MNVWIRFGSASCGLGALALMGCSSVLGLDERTVSQEDAATETPGITDTGIPVEGGPGDSGPGGCIGSALPIGEKEGGACYTGPAGTDYKGVCRKGLWQCVSSAWTCVGQVVPNPEVCDGLDNDCNSIIDDKLSRSVFGLTSTDAPVGTSLLSVTRAEDSFGGLFAASYGSLTGAGPINMDFVSEKGASRERQSFDLGTEVFQAFAAVTDPFLSLRTFTTKPGCLGDCVWSLRTIKPGLPPTAASEIGLPGILSGATGKNKVFWFAISNGDSTVLREYGAGGSRDLALYKLSGPVALAYNPTVDRGVIVGGASTGKSVAIVVDGAGKELARSELETGRVTSRIAHSIIISGTRTLELKVFLLLEELGTTIVRSLDYNERTTTTLKPNSSKAFSNERPINLDIWMQDSVTGILLVSTAAPGQAKLHRLVSGYVGTEAEVYMPPNVERAAFFQVSGTDTVMIGNATDSKMVRGRITCSP